MNEQWKELKKTIVEIRDNNEFEHEDVTLMCRFLVNYMEMLEADARAEAWFQPNSNEKTHLSQQDHNEDIATAFQFGMALGFAKKHDEMDKVIKEIKKACVSQPKTGCDGCIYEKTGNNSTYPCSHCSRCYTDKYKAESEVNNG